jgi:micrococcal nuclease
MKKNTIDFVITSIVLAGLSGAIVWQNTLQSSGLSGQSKVPSPPDNWTVIKVSDGDTLVVRQMNGREMKVRLCGIDANESKQEGGQEAKAYLKKLVEKTDNIVMVSPVTTDRYNRTVAEVFISLNNGSEQFIQEEMVKVGMARAYLQYISSCPNKNVILQAEKIAKQNRIGVWFNPNSLPPWEWRRQNKGN